VDSFDEDEAFLIEEEIDAHEPRSNAWIGMASRNSPGNQGGARRKRCSGTDAAVGDWLLWSAVVRSSAAVVEKLGGNTATPMNLQTQSSAFFDEGSAATDDPLRMTCFAVTLPTAVIAAGSFAT